MDLLKTTQDLKWTLQKSGVTIGGAWDWDDLSNLDRYFGMAALGAGGFLARIHFMTWVFLSAFPKKILTWLSALAPMWPCL